MEKRIIRKPAVGAYLNSTELTSSFFRKCFVNGSMWVLVIIVLLVSYECNSIEAHDEVDPELKMVGLTSWELGEIFVVKEYRKIVAERFDVPDYKADTWKIMGPDKLPVSLAVNSVPTISGSESPFKIGDKGVCTGAKCGGDSPYVEGRCIRRASGANTSGVNRWYRRDIIGYNFCIPSDNPKDICDVVYVNTGVWVFFSDRCRTVSRRGAWHRARWVCIP